MKKTKKRLVTVYKDGKNYVIAYLMPNGQQIAFTSRFVGK
jgi:predicted transcriptional regulator